LFFNIAMKLAGAQQLRHFCLVVMKVGVTQVHANVVVVTFLDTFPQSVGHGRAGKTTKQYKN